MKIRRISLQRSADFLDQLFIDSRYPYWYVYSVHVDFGSDAADSFAYALENFFGLYMQWYRVLQTPSSIQVFYEWLDSGLINNFTAIGHVYILRIDIGTLILRGEAEFFGLSENEEFPTIPVKDFREWLDICKKYVEDVQEFFSQRSGFPPDEDLPVYIADA